MKTKTILWIFPLVLIVGCMMASRERKASTPVEETSEVTSKPSIHPKSSAKKSKVAKPEAEPESLRRTMNETLDNLPTFADAKNDEDADPHGTPQAIFDASDRLGKIRTLIGKTPGSLSDAANFYDACARKDGVMTGIRALCYRNLMDLHAQFAERVPLDKELYSSEIRRIGENLPSEPFRIPNP